MHRLTFSLLVSLVLAYPGYAAEVPPNFIFIFCDNLGYGDIGPFGNTLHQTPHLNRMAKEGRKFTHFYATAGVCTPSRASLMTGCYAQRVNMHTPTRRARAAARVALRFASKRMDGSRSAQATGLRHHHHWKMAPGRSTAVSTNTARIRYFLRNSLQR